MRQFLIQALWEYDKWDFSWIDENCILRLGDIKEKVRINFHITVRTSLIDELFFKSITILEILYEFEKKEMIQELLNQDINIPRILAITNQLFQIVI